MSNTLTGQMGGSRRNSGGELDIPKYCKINLSAPSHVGIEPVLQRNENISLRATLGL